MSQPIDKYIKIDSFDFHYLDWGNSGAPPMILLHGLCGNAHYWDFFARSIQPDYHIIALDQRGHGDSSWTGNYGPRGYVGDLEVFLDLLGLTDIVLIGHSLGGINALLYAEQHPEIVAKLVIVDIGPEIGTAGSERMLREMMNNPISFRSLSEAEHYFKQVQPRYSETFLQHQSKYALKQDGPHDFKFKFDPELHETKMVSPDWLWGYLERIVCPTLILRGSESDVLLMDVAHKMVESLVFGCVTEIDSACHSIPGDNPQAFEEAVRKFLTD